MVYNIIKFNSFALGISFLINILYVCDGKYICLNILELNNFNVFSILFFNTVSLILTSQGVVIILVNVNIPEVKEYLKNNNFPQFPIFTGLFNYPGWYIAVGTTISFTMF
jgi:hypothetical protein